MLQTHVGQAVHGLRQPQGLVGMGVRGRRAQVSKPVFEQLSAGFVHRVGVFNVGQGLGLLRQLGVDAAFAPQAHRTLQADAGLAVVLARGVEAAPLLQSAQAELSTACVNGLRAQTQRLLAGTRLLQQR